jgi:hypothetical protein
MKRRSAIVAATGFAALLSAAVPPAGSAPVPGVPSAIPVQTGNPVQFANPPFTTAVGDTASPWTVGWDPAKSAPDQLPPLQGRVDALLRVGEWVYIGGVFHRALGPGGAYDESVRHLVRARWDTGVLDPDWKPDLASSDPYGSGTVTDIITFDPGDGVTRLVVAGDFTRVDGNRTNAKYLAVFRLADPAPPTLDTAILSTADVDVNDNVHAVAHDVEGGDHVLYLGGYFTSVGTAGGGRGRSHLAKLRLTGGRFVLDDQWTPILDSTDTTDVAHQWVSRIAPVPGHDRVVIGGFWTSIDHRGPAQEKYLAAVDRGGGAVQPWANPISKSPAGEIQWSSTKRSSKFPVFDLVLADEGGIPMLYTAHGGTNLAAKWDPATGTRLWYWWSDGGVQAVTTLNGNVYFGFHGHHISPVAGGYKKDTLTVTREGLWAVSPDGTTLLAFGPSFKPPLRTTTEGARKIWALHGAGNLYVGGDFTEVAGTPLAKFAVFPVL